MLRDDRILDLAEIHCDLDTDSRGRKSFEFDNHGVVAFARAVEQAAYAAAIKACEASAEHEEEARALQRADAARGGDENEELARLRHLSDVRLFNAGISTCAEAIRSLMQEQPK